uniref:ATP synthase subunit O, mitochondrial n=1 Tax=Myxine glutinosa TaxID=7769 RepID=UPI00358F401C
MAAFRLPHLARSFTTSASVCKLVRPPLQVYGVEGRYATALYSAGSKQKQLPQLENQINNLMVSLKSSQLSYLVMNPHIKKNQKIQAFSQLLAKDKASPLLVNLVSLLGENSRLPLLPQVASAFAKIMAAHRGEISCIVTTAQPLEKTIQTELQTVLEGFLEKGQVIKMEMKIDSSILGGMVVSLGDRYVDMSTKSKVHKLTSVLRQAA